MTLNDILALISGIMIGASSTLIIYSFWYTKNKAKYNSNFATIESFISSELEKIIENKNAPENKKADYKLVIDFLKKYKVEDFINSLSSEDSTKFKQAITVIKNNMNVSRK